jgi:hypothetical protein
MELALEDSMKKLFLTMICTIIVFNCFAGSELWDCNSECKKPKNIDAMECEHCHPEKTN